MASRNSRVRSRRRPAILLTGSNSSCVVSLFSFLFASLLAPPHLLRNQRWSGEECRRRGRSSLLHRRRKRRRSSLLWWRSEGEEGGSSQLNSQLNRRGHLRGKRRRQRVLLFLLSSLNSSLKWSEGQQGQYQRVRTPNSSAGLKVPHLNNKLTIREFSAGAEDPSTTVAGGASNVFNSGSGREEDMFRRSTFGSPPRAASLLARSSSVAVAVLVVIVCSGSRSGSSSTTSGGGVNSFVASIPKNCKERRTGSGVWDLTSGRKRRPVNNTPKTWTLPEVRSTKSTLRCQ